MKNTSPEIQLSQEAIGHLEHIKDEEIRLELSRRLGQLSVIDTSQIDRPLERHLDHEATPEAVIHGQTERTQSLINGIAQRAKGATLETGDGSSSETSPETIWGQVLDMQLTDIELAYSSGEKDKTDELILEHMVTLELGFGEHSRRVGEREHQAYQDQTSRSLLKLVKLGLAESVVSASREAYGMVTVTRIQSDGDSSYFGRSDVDPGTPVEHRYDSVAHTFEASVEALEVGLGADISLDPEEAAISATTVESEKIDKLNLVASQIAVETRIAKTKETGATPEDTKTIEFINHNALRKLFTQGEGDAEFRTQALLGLAKLTPDLASNPVYDADFAFLRQSRFVNSNFRQNNMNMSKLDSVIVLCVIEGNLDLAKQLLTTNQAELINPNGPDRRGLIPDAIKYGIDRELSEEEQNHVLERISSIQQEKNVVLARELDVLIESITVEDIVLTDSLKKQVLSSRDPESALLGLQAIQKAAGENPNIEQFKNILIQLSKKYGTNENTFLELVSANTEVLAPLLFNEEFQNLSESTQHNILWDPKRADQILRLHAHPKLEVFKEEYSAGEFIYKADNDNDTAKRLLEVLDQSGPLLETLKSANLDRHTGYELINTLMKSEDIPAKVAEITELFGETKLLDTFLLLQNAGVGEESLNIFQAVLGAENSVDRVEGFYKAFTETKILDLIGVDGPAYAFKNTIVNLLITSENPVNTAVEINEKILSNDSLWLKSYKLSQLVVGDIESLGFQEGLRVKEIPLSLPAPNLSPEQQIEVLRTQPPKLFAELSVEEKRSVAKLGNLTDEQVSELQDVLFSQLTPEYKSTILAFRLFETIALSRNPSEQQAATERNIQRANDEVWFKQGDLVHSTSSTISLRAILTTGALAGETLGMNGRRDSYPYNLDTVLVSSDVTSQPDYPAQLGALKNQSYGQISIVFARGPDALRPNEEFTGRMNDDHTLMLGGLPSTEISAILLRQDPTPETISAVRRIVVESGIYIPVVGQDGKLLLSFEEFKAIQQDVNILAIQPDIVDGAFERPASQEGSNAGAGFIVPQGKDKEPEQWYVKFGDTDPDRLWTELLSDQLYRTVTPAVVPTTRPIIVEGRLARASKVMPTDSGALTEQARNEAFIMDCLLGNWDAVYNDANILMSGGHGLRIDTGNGLDFKARGEKKPVGTFAENVGELEIGTDKDDLAKGMRQMYPGLSDDEISAQVSTMQEKLTDDVIDQLVDGVRRPSGARTELKRILKARRDYIVEYFSA